jgi:hypothetical protein
MKLFVCVSCAALLSACGGGSSSPSAPTPPPAPAAPTFTGLSISGADALRTGFYTNYTATVSLSNGTTQPATNVTWSTDNGSVATVERNGDLTGYVNGNVTVRAASAGLTATKVVHVVSNFSGDWRGTYRVNKCDDSGAFAGVWCRGLGGVGTILPVSMSLSQGGTSRDQVSGQLALGSFVGPVTGNVTGDGRLVLGGSFISTSGTSTVQFVIGGWDVRLSNSTGLNGGWAHTLQLQGLTGNVYQENTFVSATQSNIAAVPVGPQRDLGDRMTPPAVAPMSFTVAELAAMMRVARPE